ncbi:MAG: hypothetical protein HZC40_10970 [Chloroflexi bacterium]|nr:hypothetical protein [Chloroflexota bacterium]
MLDAPRREKMIDDYAHHIARAGMRAPALLALQMHLPLSFLGAQLIWIAQPFLTFGFKDADVRDLALLLEDRANVQALIDRLESFDQSSAG